MKLSQKRFFGPTVVYELTDTSVRITTKGRLSESSYEVPFAEIRPTPAYHRNVSPHWLIIALFFYLFSGVALAGVIHPVEGTERLGFIILFLVVCAFAVQATMVFARTKMDVVIWHSVINGSPAIVMDRHRPSPRHVQEFTEMIAEKLTQAKVDAEET